MSAAHSLPFDRLDFRLAYARMGARLGAHLDVANDTPSPEDFTRALKRALRDGGPAERELAERLHDSVSWDRDENGWSPPLMWWANALARQLPPAEASNDNGKPTPKRKRKRSRWVAGWSEPSVLFLADLHQRDLVPERQLDMIELFARGERSIAKLQVPHDACSGDIPGVILDRACTRLGVLGTMEGHAFLHFAARKVAEWEAVQSDSREKKHPIFDWRDEAHLCADMGLTDHRSPARLRDLLDVLRLVQGCYPNPQHRRPTEFGVLALMRSPGGPHSDPVLELTFLHAWRGSFQAAMIEKYKHDPEAEVIRRLVPSLGIPPLHTNEQTWAKDCTAALHAAVYFRQQARAYADDGCVRIPRHVVEHWALRAGFSPKHRGRTVDRILRDWTTPGGKHDANAPALIERVDVGRYRLSEAYRAAERKIQAAGRKERGGAKGGRKSRVRR